MTLIVGHVPRRNDRSPISLGAMLARSLGRDLLVVSVVPAPWPTPLPGNADREYAEWSRTEGAAAVAAARTMLEEIAPDLDSRAVCVPGRSVPVALLEQAEQVDATLVVVGSGTNGAWGTVVLGSTADRLLHSSHLPVAVAPRGFSTHAVPEFTRATCAFRADDASLRALRDTADICADAGADLRVVTFGVLGKTMYPPEVGGEKEILRAFVEQTATAQDSVIAQLREEFSVPIESLVATGRSWADALESVEWEHGDLLVVGSSTGGTLSRVFLGSNATRIVRHSPVPAVVVPA
jgi:nucleotide-binding universal stress UspA family protein